MHHSHTHAHTHTQSHTHTHKALHSCRALFSHTLPAPGGPSVSDRHTHAHARPLFPTHAHSQVKCGHFTSLTLPPTPLGAGRDWPAPPLLSPEPCRIAGANASRNGSYAGPPAMASETPAAAAAAGARTGAETVEESD